MCIQTLSPSTAVRNLQTPILGNLLQNRKLCLAITGATALHIGLTVAGLPSYQCPARAVGIPCPGCGLSRACVALFQGNFETAFKYHLFAPLLILALTSIAIVTFLPQSLRNRSIKFIAKIETLTGLTAVLLIALVIYWLVRLIFFQQSFISLIVG